MAGNSQEYISHHLTNLTYGKLPAGYVRHEVAEDGTVHEHELTTATWTMAHNSEEAAQMGFTAVNVDSLGWSSPKRKTRPVSTRMVSLRQSTTQPSRLQSCRLKNGLRITKSGLLIIIKWRVNYEPHKRMDPSTSTDGSLQ